MADLNDEAAQTAEQLKKVQDALAALGITVGEVNQAEREAIKNTRKNTDALMESQYGVKNFSKAADQGKVAITALAGAASAAVKAIYNNQQGTKAFSGTMTGMGTAFDSVTTAAALLFPQFRGLALAANLAGKALINYAKAAAEQSDSLFGTYQSLSKSGAAASDGMTGVFQDAQKLGLGFQGLERYTQLIAESSKELALFGGSVFEGRKRFADVGLELTQYRRGLMNLGMTQDEINDGTMSYIRLQSRLGETQGKTNDDLARSANAYMQEQDALTKLTGLTRKEQESAREEIRSQERFAAQLMKVRATQGEEAANNLENTYLTLYAFNKDAAQGFADVSTGFLTTEAAVKSYRATQGESMKTAQLLSDGQITAAEGAQRVAAAHGRTVTAMGMTMGAVGTYGKTYGNMTGDLRLEAASRGDIAAKSKKIEEDRIKQGADGNAAADAAVRAQNDMRRAQQETMLALQKLVNLGVVPVTDFLSGLAKIIDTFALSLTKFARFLGFGTDAKPQSPGEIKVTEAKKAADDAELKVREKEWKVVNAREAADKKIAETELEAAKTALTTAQAAKTAAIRSSSGQVATTVSMANTGEGAAVGFRQAIRKQTGVTPAGPGAAATGGATPGSAAPSATSATPGAPMADNQALARTGGAAGAPIKIGLGGGGSNMSEQQIKNMIIAHEGKRLEPYKDSLGLWTVGIGHLIGDGKSLPPEWNRKFSEEEIMALFEKDYAHHRTAAESIAGFNKLNSRGQGALTDLTFNMGPGWIKSWPNLQKQLADQNVAGAAENLAGSKWATQVGQRGPVIIDLLRNGVSAADGGMFAGPRSGYAATLHGAEAVIPLKNGAVPVDLGISDQLKGLKQDSGTNNRETTMQKIVDEFKSTMQATVENIMRSTSSGDGMNAVAGILNEMVSQQKNSNDIQAKILRAAAV